MPPEDTADGAPNRLLNSCYKMPTLSFYVAVVRRVVRGVAKMVIGRAKNVPFLKFLERRQILISAGR